MLGSTQSASRNARRRPGVADADPTQLDPREQIRAWLRVVDAVLVAIEETAWQAREIGARTREAVTGVQGSLGRVVAGGRALANELSVWPERLGRLTITGLALTRIATGYRLHATKAAFMSKERAKRALEELHNASAQRFYELSVRQGGAFLKVGQMLSARPDLLPDAWIVHLQKLQDQAPEVPFDAIRRAIERELGCPLEEAFESLEEAPLAAASIGQVHTATLRDGRKVAVKVQRPNIGELVLLDMELLELFARGLAEHLPPLDFDTIVGEVREMIGAELDYAREAEATRHVSEFFENDAWISAPRVIFELSTSRMLVTEMMQGDKITRVLDRLREARDGGDGEAQGKLSTLLVRVLEAYARQVLELGFFQADPHPGNMLATDEGKLVLLDFGCSREVDAERKQALIALVRATFAADPHAMADAMAALGFETDSGSREGLAAYAKLVLDEVKKAKQKGGDWPSQADVLGQMANMARTIEDDPITRLPSEFVMLGRVIGTLSGLFLHYRPDMSATLRVLPIVLAALAKR